MKRKLIAFILCIGLLFLSLPVISLAEETPFYKAIEAEGEEAIINSGFVVKEDQEASGGAYLEAALGQGAAPARGETEPLVYKINVPKDGIYSVFIRWGSFQKNSESIWFALNDEAYKNMYKSWSNEYLWHRYNVNLHAGENTLNFHYRKAYFRLDKIIVTNAIGYSPIGTGQEPKDLWTPIDYNTEQSMYGSIPLPSYIPPKSHPRVMVTADKISAIRNNLNHPENIEAYNMILKYAQYSKEECELVPPQKGGNNYSVRGLGYMASNAFLYLIEGDKECGRKAVEGTISFLETLDISSLSPTNASRQGGYALYVSAEVYDWCYDLMTDEERHKIVEAGLKLMGNFEFTWLPSLNELAYESGHACESEFLKCELAFGIAVYDEYPDIFNIVGGRIFNEYVPAKNFLYENGSFNQMGPNYSGFRFPFEMYMTYLLDNIGAKNLVSPKQRDYLTGSILTRLPDGGQFKSGDSNYHVLEYTSDFKTALFFAFNYYKDPFLKQEFYKITGGNGTSGFGHINVNPQDFLICNDVSIGVDSIKKFPLTNYLGNHMGAMVARTSWDEGQDSNAMLVFMSMPEKFIKGHSHYDSGQFQIYYKGHLALKSGCYSSNFGSAHDYGYHKQSISANCMLIHNPENDTFYSGNYPLMGGQKYANNKISNFAKTYENFTGEMTDAGKILGYDYGADPYQPSFSYLKGDLTKAYDGNAKNYTRTFLFLNFFDEIYPGALVVFDKVVSNSNYKKTWLLHSEEEPEINGTRTTICRTEDGFSGRLVNETLLPSASNAVLSKIGGEGKEYMVNGINYPFEASYKCTGKWRVELTPKSASETDYFLNVLQCSDNNLDPVPLESQLMETEKYAGVQIKDRVAWFSKSETRSGCDITVKTVDGSQGNFIFMIDGLYPGVWNVMKGDTVISSCQVSENSGVLSFEAEAGEYTLHFVSLKTKDKTLGIYDHINHNAKTGIYLRYNDLYYDLEDPIKEKDNEIYVPIKSFSDFMDATCEESEDGAIIISKENQKVVYEKSEIIMENEVAYALLEKCKEVLGVKYSYSDYCNILNLSKTQYITIEGEQIKNSSDPSRIPIVRIKSEIGDPTPMVDGNTETSWVQEGSDIELIFEFTSSTSLSGIRVKWRVGDTRKSYYDVYISEDGENYTLLCEGESSGTTTELENLTIPACKTRFVKLVTKGNSQNEWNGIHEIEFYK